MNILIVDNDIAATEETRTLLQKEEPRLKLDLAYKGQEGLRKARGGGYDLIVSEYHLTPTMNGLQLLDALRASGIETPFIIYSSEKSLERVVDCLRRGAEDYLFKEKQNIRELASSITKAVEQFRSQRGHHKLLQQIQEEKNYLENIIVNSIDAVVVADREGKVTLWNKGAEHLFGYTAEEVMGKHVDQFIVPPKFRRTEEKLLKLVEKKGGSFLEKEVKRVRKSGEVIYTTASYNLVRDTNGKIIGLSAIEKDITEHKRLDRELEKAKEKYRLQYQREQRKSTILNTITKVSRKITAILELEKLLQKVINIILALGYYHVSIWTTQPENEQVVYKTGDPESLRIRKGANQRFNEGIIGCVAYTGKPILANDVSKEPKYLNVYRKTKSELSVPIRFGPRILGVLDVQSINLNAFTREDLSALQILADQIAVAMENARLYEEARSKGDYLQSLIRNVTDAIISIDSQGKVVEWNKGAQKLFGCAREEILGKELDAIIVPKDKKEEAATITKRAMAGREIINFETSRQRKNGTLSNVLLSASPIIKGKKFLGAVAIYKDITERKRALEALQASEEKYKTLTSNINVGVYRNTVGPKGKFIEVNPAIVKMFGYKSREEFLALNVADLYQNPADRQKFNNKMLKFGYVRDEELQLKKKDGTPFISSVSAVAAKDKKGKVMHYDGIIEDITERKQAEEALRIKDSAIASSISAIAITDLEGNLTYVNNSFLKLWGYNNAEEVIGKPAIKFWQLEEKASKVLEVSHHKGSWIGELVAMRKDGSLFDVHLFASRVTDEAGKPICMMASFIDITERKRIENEIKRKSQELESFVYTVSHDLKSPLISIKGFSELLKASSSDKLGEKGLHQLERIVKNIDEMNRLIGDLLKLSRAGKTTQQPQKIDTLSLAKEIVEELNLQFKIDHPTARYRNLPVIYADWLHFRQILQNLMSNAYKFRDENKKLEITVGCTEVHNTYQFYVKDNGIGIEEQHLEDIFHIFRRLEYKQVEGTGAGLAIVKKIVESNGGKIWVKSAKGKGSTFYFTFPKRMKTTSTRV